MNYRQADAVAKARDSQLTAKDFGDTGVALHMEDGSFFMWKDAFADRVCPEDGKWVVVFTEHYGFHVFDREDILHLNTFYQKRVGHEV